MASAVDASLSSSNALEDQTVAWENAKDLPFIGTDASLADKSGFKNSTSSDSNPSLSMMKSKAFGQSKPLEGDLLANIEESELDDLFSSADKEIHRPSPRAEAAPVAPTTSTPKESKPPSVSAPPVSTESQPEIIQQSEQSSSSMRDTITKVQLDAPQSKDMHDTVKFDDPKGSPRIAASTDNPPVSSSSPLKQSSEELLSVLDHIDSKFPDGATAPEKPPVEKKVSIQDATVTETKSGSEAVKPQRQKSLSKDLSAPKAADNKAVKKGKGSVTELSTEDMINAAEALALKAKHQKGSLSTQNQLPPKKPPTSPSENKNPRRKSKIGGADATGSDDPVGATAAAGTTSAEANSKRKSSLPPLVKKPTPRRKADDASVTADEQSTAGETTDAAANARVRQKRKSLGGQSSVASDETDDDASKVKSTSKAAVRKPRSSLPELVKDKDGATASNVQISPIKNAGGVLSKKRELMQQYTKRVPAKDPSKFKLPPIAGAKDLDAGSADEGHLTSQETPGRAAPSSHDAKTRAPHSSPPFSRNSNPRNSSEAVGTTDDNNSLSSPTKKRRKPLYLRMIAKAQKLLLDEERRKQEDYNKQRALRPKNTPSRAELKDHMHKFEEFMKSKAELSRQNHVAQIRALKEQRRHQTRRASQGLSQSGDDDGDGSITSMDAGESILGDPSTFETAVPGETTTATAAANATVANVEKTPIKGAAKAKLQKDLEKFEHITQVLAEQKKERQRHYQGLLKKAGLVDANQPEAASPAEKTDSGSHEHSPHHDHITPTKPKKTVKTTMAMHVVTIGDDPETMHQLSPRGHEADHQHSGHKKKSPRQSTPHRTSHATIDNDIPHDEEDDDENKTLGTKASVSFNMLDVLDDEALEVLNHHRHAGEEGPNGGTGGGGAANGENGEEGEEMMVPISLADYIPALNEQPLPETVKVSEGFFDDVLKADGSAAGDDIVKVITADDDEELMIGEDAASNRTVTAGTSVTSVTDELASTMTVIPATAPDGDDDGSIVNVPDLTDKEVAYFVADDWIDMLAASSMSMDAPPLEGDTDEAV